MSTIRGSDQLEALLEAARDGDVRFLCSLIDNGFDIGSRDVLSSGLFNIAYTQGHQEFVLKLLEAGFNLDFIVIEELPKAQQWQNYFCLRDVLWFKVYREALKSHSKLSEAVFNATFKNDYCTIVKLLRQGKSCWKSGASSGDRYNDFHSVLLFLLMYNSECPSEVLRTLIDKGANVDSNYHGFSLCDYAVLCGNAKGLSLLLDNGCLVDGKHNDGSFLVFRHAVTFGKVDCLELLLGNTDLSKSRVWEDNGAELIALAVRCGQDICVDLLLKYNARVERTASDDSPLLIVCKTGNFYILNSLLKHGVNINVCTDDDETPLIFAAVFGHLPCLNALITHNAEINAVDCDNQTALMHAVQRGNVECVNVLISAGADIFIVNNNDETALILAITLPDKECLELILLSSSSQQCPSSSHCESVQLDRFHRKAFELALRQFDVKSLLVLLKYGIFSWQWIDSIVQEELLPTEILARVLVASNIPPGSFHAHSDSSPKTLFQSALANQDIWTAYYLMGNLYLNKFDIVYLQQRQRYITKLHHHHQHQRQKENSHHVNLLLNTLESQPLPLQLLCIFTLSSQFDDFSFGKGNEKKRREEQIERLPIPAKFKNVLNFQGPYADVCVDNWKALGTHMSQEGFDRLRMTLRGGRLEEDLRCCKGEGRGCGDNPKGFRYRHYFLTARLL